MSNTVYYLLAIAVASAITFLLRAVPFGMKAALAESKLIASLATWIPLGAMVALALYALGGIDFSSSRTALPYLIATVVTVAVHLWKRNFMLTLLIGTATCVVLANWVFV